MPCIRPCFFLCLLSLSLTGVVELLGVFCGSVVVDAVVVADSAAAHDADEKAPEKSTHIPFNVFFQAGLEYWKVYIDDKWWLKKS